MAEYETIRKLGAGNQGQVWLVENKATNHYGAMKIYSAWNGAESAKRELGVLRRFGGKGVPYLLDYQENEDSIRLVMEYIEGSSLRDLMKKQKIWKEKECVDIVREIANILAAFHRQSPAMIYGDLKPENIMIGQDRNVYLIDFGSVVEEGERKRKVYGTKVYLPPDEEDISPYRDTYALGVIMYEMLTGKVLSQGIGTGKADIRHLSPACQRIMKKAVKICKESGYTDARVMCKDLKAYEEDMGKEQFMRKWRQHLGRKHKKQNEYISDMKRAVMHGYKKGLCILFIAMMIIGLWQSATRIEAAEQKTQISAQEIPEQGILMQEISAQEVLRDEYGRKILVRNVDN